MHDMSAFERQVADEMVRIVGPSRYVDDLAVYEAVTTQSPKWRFQSMFSATKFVVAGAIVALFGGFLLSGVLIGQPSDDRLPAVGASASAQAEPTDAMTTEPEPTTEVEADGTTATPDLLPGVDLVTVEVEPGVFRVVHDGVRDLSHMISARSRSGAVIAGLDGSVWHFRSDGFYRLGDDRTHAWGERERRGVGAEDDVEVGPDGTIWWVVEPFSGVPNLSSFDGQKWVIRRERTRKGSVREVEVLPDGGVWAAWSKTTSDGKRIVRIGELVEGEWRLLQGSVPGCHGPSCSARNFTSDDTLAVMAAGDVWYRARLQNSIERHDGNTWQKSPFDGLFPAYVQGEDPEGRPATVELPLLDLDVGPDGTAWANRRRDGGRSCVRGAWCISLVPSLVRFDGVSIDAFDDRRDLPVIADEATFYEVAGDGSLWYASSGLDGCHGLVNFDGEDVHHLLRDLCVQQADVAPDGSVWAQASTDGGSTETYVITPEAVAATE